MSICSKESSFDLKSEGFFYSASRLPEVWSYFKKNDPVANGFVNPKTKTIIAEALTMEELKLQLMVLTAQHSVEGAKNTR